MLSVKPATLISGLLMLSLVTIAIAWAFQIIGGYAPCPLCLQQRWAYYIAIAFCIGALLTLNVSKYNFALTLIAVVGLVYAYNSGLGFYHAGIEWKFWEGPASCAGTLGDTTAGSLVDRINSQRIVLCNEAPWRFLGLSFAGYNMLISAALSLLSLFSFLRVNSERKTLINY